MNRIEFGDCRETLRRWGEVGVKVKTCVTSPPYFGLRDYGHHGQLGLEQTPEEYIAAMVEVFRCVRDVLADDGTLWLNIGDSYASAGGQSAQAGQMANRAHGKAARSARFSGDGIKNKDLIGIPWMLAFALRDDGAASPAHMRLIEEVISTVTASYDCREQWPDRIAALVERLEREHIDANRGGWYLRQDLIWSKPNPMPESVRDRCTKANEYLFLLSKSERYYYDAEAVMEPVAASTVERLGQPTLHQQEGSARVPGKTNGNMKAVGRTDKRNRRSVWTIATRPYKGAHFATFPPALVEPCILAGSRPGDIVLDPFMGSGTTAAVAIQNGRQYLGCELNPDYGPLQDQRIAAAAESVSVSQPDLFNFAQTGSISEPAGKEAA